MSMKELEKNKGWWEEVKYKVTIKMPNDEKKDSHLIEEFKDFYEERVVSYFLDETVNAHIKLKK